MGEHLILYDGVCGLCNRVNRFVLARDDAARFEFASLQSSAASTIMQRFGLTAGALTTFLVIERHRSSSPRLRSRSDAALFVAANLDGWARWLGVARVLPASWRDGLYDFVARHRYRLFGRYDVCPVPSPAERSRFIDV